jgi:hypothetical protein
MSRAKQVKRIAKDTQITARLPAVVRQVAMELAEEEGLSLAGFIEHLIRAEARRQGKPVRIQTPQQRSMPRAYSPDL